MAAGAGWLTSAEPRRQVDTAFDAFERDLAKIDRTPDGGIVAYLPERWPRTRRLGRHSPTPSSADCGGVPHRGLPGDRQDLRRHHPPGTADQEEAEVRESPDDSYFPRVLRAER